LKGLGWKDKTSRRNLLSENQSSSHDMNSAREYGIKLLVIGFDFYDNRMKLSFSFSCR
jgi:hypothetical protein